MEKKLSSTLGWIDDRFPLSKLWREHLSEYYAPKNFNFWYFFGALALVVLVIQIITGIILVMHYKPDANLNADGLPIAFASVEYIMREVPFGWLIRYMHATGASAFFIVVYLHMFRGLLYGSYRKPRELIWIFGMLIYLCLMAEAFFGYLLPWGQMSFWGAQVIVSLFSAVPIIGEDLAILVRGDYNISDATLNRFFSLHVIALPLALVGLVAAHIIALHEVGSNNPDGIDIKKNKNADGIPVDGIPFHPYYTVKDIVGVTGFMFIFMAVVFFAPEGGGYFIEYNNYLPADPLQTPNHIAPVWYFTAFYSMLRATTDIFTWVLLVATVVAIIGTWLISRASLNIKIVLSALALIIMFFLRVLEAKFWGVVVMFAAVLILFALPWLDQSPVRSIRYKGPIFKTALGLFVVSFLLLSYLGVQSPTPIGTALAQICTVIYFAFFLLMPWYSSIDSYKREPERVT